MTTETTPTPRVRLGILQTGRAPHELIGQFPDYDQMFVQFLGEDSFDYRHWAVLDNEFPAGIEEADAWLITGSKHGAYEDHPWIPPLEQLIRDVYGAGAPMVGICFGHQIIAQALGGSVEKYAGGWAVGHHEYTLDSKVFGKEVYEGKTPLLAFHQDQVTKVPPMAENVGSSDFCQHAALLYDSRILTLQPHPEFSQEYVGGLLDVRGEILPESILSAARNALDKDIQNLPIANTIRQFLQRQDIRNPNR